MSEQWRVVPSLLGRYEVSNRGRVRSFVTPRTSTNMLSVALTKEGYCRIVLQVAKNLRRTMLVHRLVAEAFLGPTPDGQEVNHKDGDKTNNRPENLEYMTRLGNMRHATDVLGVINGPVVVPRGRQRPNSKMTDDAIRELRELRKQGWSYHRLAEHFQISRWTVEDIARGKTWTHVA